MSMAPEPKTLKEEIDPSVTKLTAVMSHSVMAPVASVAILNVAPWSGGEYIIVCTPSKKVKRKEWAGLSGLFALSGFPIVMIIVTKSLVV